MKAADLHRAAVRTLSERSLYDFVEYFWHVLEPGTSLVRGWHMEAICDHLQAVTRGQITTGLLINVSPGSSKSLLTSVFWPAWEWGPAGFPHHRIITTSYKATVPGRDALKMKRLVMSPEYEAIWGNRGARITDDQSAKTRFQNAATGERLASTFTGVIGERGERIILDDPHSPDSAKSATKRTAEVDRFFEGVYNRVSGENAVIVVIMQRLHERDISGEILARDLGFEHLCIPMEYEGNEASTFRKGVDPRTTIGELMCPARFGRDKIREFQEGMGDNAYAGQYQQRPVARTGGFFQRESLEIIDTLPATKRSRVRKWDLAGSLDGDWTAGVLMSKDADGKCYVEDVRRLRGTPDRVRAAIRNTAALDGKDVRIIIPQDPGQAGVDQAQSIMRQMSGYRIKAERETGSKETRAEPFADQCNAGNVAILKAPWNQPFIDELCGFPRGEYDDQVDAAAGAFAALAKPRSVVAVAKY